MSSMIEQAPVDLSGQVNATQFSQSAPVHKIKRIGGRPLVFEGIELAMAMSFTPTLPYWYETNLYRTSNQKFVACVKLFYQSADEQDTARAWECGSLEEAIEVLVRYNAADDVRLSFDQIGSDCAAAELGAYALELRARVKNHRRHYASLIGEFLHELDAGH